ncbi:hypothetical protein NQ315_001055 [Exocentrus adspersus]|uniref:Uncharacterized protein n=1 Tax=Exocentrus adspersus TaxID=1586481 RepID=A0AAV8WEE7_9CUCU|nr:hypothetical protein NQ315_001055 [Exocentrus adspersus]
MSSLKVVAVFLLAGFLKIQCSVLAPAAFAVPPAIRYTLVAPHNIRPFAAQVSTFTKGLSVYAAPYAAGVIGGPAIVPAPHGALYPAPAQFIPAPAPVVPAAAPFVPAAAPAHLLPPPFARSVHAVAPAWGPPAAPYLGWR